MTTRGKQATDDRTRSSSGVAATPIPAPSAVDVIADFMSCIIAGQWTARELAKELAAELKLSGYTIKKVRRG